MWLLNVLPLCFIFELVSKYPTLSSTNEKKNIIAIREATFKGDYV